MQNVSYAKHTAKPDKGNPSQSEFEGVGEEEEGILIWWTDERHGWLTLLRNLLRWAMRSPAPGLSQRRVVFGRWMVAPRGTSSWAGFCLQLSSVITHPSLWHRKKTGREELVRPASFIFIFFIFFIWLCLLLCVHSLWSLGLPMFPWLRGLAGDAA